MLNLYRRWQASTTGMQLLLLVLFGWFSFGHQPCLMAKSQSNSHAHQSTRAIHRHLDCPDCETGHCVEDQIPGSKAEFSKVTENPDNSVISITLVNIDSDGTTKVKNHLWRDLNIPKVSTGPPLYIKFCSYLI